MRYAIISDIHGNLEALQAILASIKKSSIDSIICLGDVVGYGANPNECVETISTRADLVLAGNHDYAGLGKLSIENFNQYAREAIEWTARQLNPSSVDFLENLPLIKVVEDFTVVHATPQAPDTWSYIGSIYDAQENFKHFSNNVCLVGHSHIPIVITQDDHYNCRVLKEKKISLEKGLRYIFNVGSVGQPRDRNPAAAYAIIDTESHEYMLVRNDYDIQKAMKKIKKANLPAFLADRLLEGK